MRAAASLQLSQNSRHPFCRLPINSRYSVIGTYKNDGCSSQWYVLASAPTLEQSYMGVSSTWGILFVGVFIIRALLFGGLD